MIVLRRGHTLPVHLLEQLKEWHRENPTKQPPASYRGNSLTSYWGEVFSIFSRTGEDITELLGTIRVVQPVQYAMLVLHGQRAKFVACVGVRGRRTFFKGWLGKHEYEDEACAVRMTSPMTQDFPHITENMFKAADRTMPVRKPSDDRLRTILTNHKANSSATSSSDGNPMTSTILSASTPREQQFVAQTEQPPSVQDDNTPAAKIIFRLIAPMISAVRCFTIKGNEAGDEIFQKSREFFGLFNNSHMATPVLLCKVTGAEELRYIYDGPELELLLEELQAQARSNIRTVIVEITHELRNLRWEYGGYEGNARWKKK
jgi:hypothetical protein